LNNTSHKDDHCKFDGAVIDKIFHSSVAAQLEQEIEYAVIVDVQQFQSLTHNNEAIFQIFFCEVDVIVVG
jgi:hypothetical protein